VQAILSETGLEPGYLELELTETFLMQDWTSTSVVLQALRVMGVQLALDDFGTGYSSLSYLKRFPVDRLKIDGSFVRDIAADTDDAAIVRTIIALGHNLGLKVLAEGVETEAQVAFLKANDCDEMQGYHFSKPVSAWRMRKLLAR